MRTHILYVMKFLGHRNIKNTLIYTQLVTFKKAADVTCKLTNTSHEIKDLIENGCEYVCYLGNLKFFRKRK